MFIGPHTTRIRLDPITSSPISSTIRENARKNDVHLRFFTIEIREKTNFYISMAQLVRFSLTNRTYRDQTPA